MVHIIVNWINQTQFNHNVFSLPIPILIPEFEYWYWYRVYTNTASSIVTTSTCPYWRVLLQFRQCICHFTYCQQIYCFRTRSFTFIMYYYSNNMFFKAWASMFSDLVARTHIGRRWLVSHSDFPPLHLLTLHFRQYWRNFRYRYRDQNNSTLHQSSFLNAWP